MDRGRRRRLTAVAALVLAATAGCERNGNAPPPLPPAEAYDRPADFAGEWIGEVGGISGSLSITSLTGGRYRGLFREDDTPRQYVLSLQQTMVDKGGTPVPGNRAVFTWQDGRGGRGEGWLLINREDSALTGEFGEGGGHSGGTWTFIRVE